MSIALCTNTRGISAASSRHRVELRYINYVVPLDLDAITIISIYRLHSVFLVLAKRTSQFRNGTSHPLRKRPEVATRFVGGTRVSSEWYNNRPASIQPAAQLNPVVRGFFFRGRQTRSRAKKVVAVRGTDATDTVYRYIGADGKSAEKTAPQEAS